MKLTTEKTFDLPFHLLLQLGRQTEWKEVFSLNSLKVKIELCVLNEVSNLI